MVLNAPLAVGLLLGFAIGVGICLLINEHMNKPVAVQADSRPPTTSARRKRQRNRRSYEKECAICLNRSPDVILKPCEHKCVCKGCFRKMLNREMYLCPICRSEYSSYYCD